MESIHAHNPLQLTVMAQLDDERAMLAKQNPVFERNWDLVRCWSEQSRYRKHSREAAGELLTAVSHRQHGVIVWIKQRW